jgi:alkyl hydroperoxide reductase subunit AhpC
LRSFQRRLPDFNTRGIRVVAISVDAPEVNRRHCQKLGFTYAFLSDSKAEVIRRYDLLHQGAGPNGSDVARPAEFLIDSTGAIRWVNLTESLAVRARPDQVLKAFDNLKQGSPAGARIQPSGLLLGGSASMGTDYLVASLKARHWGMSSGEAIVQDRTG